MICLIYDWPLSIAKEGWVTYESCLPLTIHHPQVPCHVVQSPQLIWRSGTRRWNLWVSDLQMSCWDLTPRQGSRTEVTRMATRRICPNKLLLQQLLSLPWNNLWLVVVLAVTCSAITPISFTHNKILTWSPPSYHNNILTPPLIRRHILVGRSQ